MKNSDKFFSHIWERVHDQTYYENIYDPCCGPIHVLVAEPNHHLVPLLLKGENRTQYQMDMQYSLIQTFERPGWISYQDAIATLDIEYKAIIYSSMTRNFMLYEALYPVYLYELYTLSEMGKITEDFIVLYPDTDEKITLKSDYDIISFSKDGNIQRHTKSMGESSKPLPNGFDMGFLINLRIATFLDDRIKHPHCNDLSADQAYKYESRRYFQKNLAPILASCDDTVLKTNKTQG